MGTGHPQYRCREMPQSRNLHWVRLRPRPFFSSAAAILSTACGYSRPSNSPEFMVMPYSLNASCQGGSRLA